MKKLSNLLSTSKGKKLFVSAGIIAGLAVSGSAVAVTQVLTNSSSDTVASADGYYDYYGNYVETTSYETTGTVLANGNTAGEIGSYAAAQMAAATGVPQSTWEYIIARESNGDPTAANASGASGLFQTMPGWGSTATVEDQIQAALNAYNAQGLAAWGL